MKKFQLRLLTPSTLSFIREALQVKGYSFVDFIHGYIYQRWTYFYVGIGMREHKLARLLGPLLDRLIDLYTLLEVRFHPSFKEFTNHRPVTFAETYHAKVVPLDAARQLLTVQEDIRLVDLEQVIPYTQARDIILKNPEHIVVFDCPCRVNRPNPCLPLDVCLVVGEPFASFILEHHPGKSRSITQSEALVILQAEDERGHVHHAVFKDAMFGRFYGICNCCSCCCGAMQVHKQGTPMLASSGYVAFINKSLCTGCQACVPFCQFTALSLDSGFVGVNTSACMGCGVCVDKCPQNAIELFRDSTRGEPLELSELVRMKDD